VSAPLRFVHVFSTFSRGGSQVRATQLMRHMGRGVEHVVQAMDGNIEARSLIGPGVQVEFEPAPATGGFLKTRKAQVSWLRGQRPDLVLTYNWGAIETVAAAKRAGLPQVHHEDGFGVEEVSKRFRRRNWARRWLLRGVPLIVPSRGLQRIAMDEWGVVAERLDNGVDLQRFTPAAEEPLALVVGTVGGMRPEKDYSTLLQAFAKMKRAVKLCILGGGPLERELRAECARLGLDQRVTFPGFSDDTPAHYRKFNVFVMSSRTEQMPIAVVEAMASGLPVVSTNVGDIGVMIAEPNRSLLVAPGDSGALAAALDRICADRQLRRQLGAANRAEAVARYAGDRCLEAFASVYRRACR